MDDAVPHPQPRRTAVISTSSTRRLTAARVLRRTHVAEEASWVRHKFRKEAVTRELAHGYVVGIGSDNASTTEQSGLVSGPYSAHLCGSQVCRRRAEVAAGRGAPDSAGVTRRP